jgi:hypothetical protein
VTKNQWDFSWIIQAVASMAVFAWSAHVLQPQITRAGTVWDMGKVTVISIRQVQNVPALKGKPGIEIELHNAERFHMGELDWRLQIGDFEVRRPTRRSTDHHSLTYILGLDDWNKLKDGAPLYLTWGYYDAKEKGVRPFSYLNKKMLQTPQSLESDNSKFRLTRHFRPIAKSAG